MFDLVLFDLDGTLVDTAPDIADAVNGVRREHGLPPLLESWVRDRIGTGTRELLLQAQLAGAVDDFTRHYAERCGRHGRLYPGAGAALDALRRAGVKLALLSNKERRFGRLVLEVHGLDGEFDLEIYGDTLAAKKPDPLPVRHCLHVLGVQPGHALLVGDSEIDVRTARNAGIAVWAVSYGYNGGEPIGRSQPNRIIGSLDEVTALASYGVPRASSSSLYLRNNPRNWS